MLKNLKVLGAQLRELWKLFGVKQKVSTIMALIGMIIMIAAVLVWSMRPSYRLLYAGMSLEDAASAQEALEEANVNVELKDSGRAIYVPAGDVYRSRLLLASKGLPKSTSVGFEIFEQPKFGLTDFAQNINYQRALQGELESTINSLDGVESSRVLLVLPKDQLFASADDQRASASVMLTMRSGVALNVGQAGSIRHLIAGGVEGLNPTDVTITDQYGRLVAKGTAADDALAESGEQIEMRERLEERLRMKAQQMLTTALGEGRSTVQVSADIDFSKVERQHRRYDAQGRVVRSETISSETTSTPNGAGGGVGVTANVPVGNPAGSVVDQAMAKTKREDIDTRYEIPQSLEHVVESGARVKALSVSVCVAQGETPRSDADLVRLQQMVAAAVGAVNTETRQDKVEVVEMLFPAAPAAPTPGMLMRLQGWMGGLRTLALGVIAVIVLLVVRRRVVTGLAVERSDAGIPVGNLSSGYGQDENYEAMRNPATVINHIAEQEPSTVATWITSVAEVAN